MILDHSDSCQYQQVVKVMRTIPFSPCGLSTENHIDSLKLYWRTDVEGIDQQEAGGAGGCPETSGFISPADCQKNSDSSGNQWAF